MEKVKKTKIFYMILIFVIVVVAIIFEVYIKVKDNYIYDDTYNDYEDIYLDKSVVNSKISNDSIVKASENYEKIKIYIVGEVLKPGVYELEEGARVSDAIDIAGGETENADLLKINLAMLLEDEEKIYIPSILDNEEAYNIDIGMNESGKLEKSNDDKININKATKDELKKINGVGDSLAEKIITYREENGKFNSIEELKNVSGIGEKKYETLKDKVKIK